MLLPHFSFAYRKGGDVLKKLLRDQAFTLLLEKESTVRE